jgi:RND superfamily putative drug exporter
MVFKAPDGESLNDKANHDAVMASLDRAARASGVVKVVDPYSAHTITKDGQIAFADVIYPVPADEIDDQERDQLAATAGPAREAGVQVEFGGGLVTDESTPNSESIGMMVGFVVLAITLSSLLAAGLPLITALIGVAIGLTGLSAMSGVIDVSSTAPTLATMLGLAVGIDYALFILSRHRQNMGDGLEPREAAAQAIATAGSAVVFAGATVVIALVGLTVVGIPFLNVMGLAAAGTVAIAVLIALTLVPAILGFAGQRIARANRVLGYRPGRVKSGRTMSVRWASAVTRRPLPVVLACLALLGAIALPADPPPTMM